MPHILCYGDSNTYGTAPMVDLTNDDRIADRWPQVMGAALGPNWQVTEAGLPARTTMHDDPIDGAHLNGLAVLPAVLMSHRPIDLVIFMLGTNDTKARFGLTGADIAVGMRHLSQTTRTFLPNAKVLIICPPAPKEQGCLAEFFAGAEARAAHMPRWYRYFANENGAAFLDANEVIAVDPLDGVHFGAASHSALGEAVARKIREELSA